MESILDRHPIVCSISQRSGGYLGDESGGSGEWVLGTELSSDASKSW